MKGDKKVNAIYVGLRVTTKKRLSYFWQFPGEEKLRGYNKQIAPALIGETWCITERGDSVLIRGEDAPVKVETALCKEWRTFVAMEEAAKHEYAAIKAHSYLAKRTTQFEKAVAPLCEFVAQPMPHDVRAALIARVTSELWRAWSLKTSR